MSDEKATPAPEDPQHTSFDLGYAGESKYSAAEGQPGELALFGNLRRDPVQLQGKIKRPLPFREAMAVPTGSSAEQILLTPQPPRRTALVPEWPRPLFSSACASPMATSRWTLPDRCRSDFRKWMQN